MGFGNAVAMKCVPAIHRIFVLDMVGPTVWVIDTTDPQGGVEPQLLSVNGVIATYNVGTSGVPSTILHTIEYDGSTTNLIYLADGASNTIYTVDPSTGSVTTISVTATDNQSHTLNGPIAALSTGETTNILSLMYNYSSGTNFVAADMLNSTTVQHATYTEPIPAWHSISFYQNGLVSGSNAPGGFFVDASGNQGAFANSAPNQFEYPFPSALNTQANVVGGYYLISGDNTFIYFPVYFLEPFNYFVVRMNVSGSFYNTQAVPSGAALSSNVTYSPTYDYLFVADSTHKTICYAHQSASFTAGVILPEATTSLQFEDNTSYPLGDQFGIWALASTHLYRWSIPQTGLSPSNQYYIYVPLPNNYLVTATLAGSSSTTATLGAAYLLPSANIASDSAIAADVTVTAPDEFAASIETDSALVSSATVTNASEIAALLETDSSTTSDSSVNYAVDTVLQCDSSLQASTLLNIVQIEAVLTADSSTGAVGLTGNYALASQIFSVSIGFPYLVSDNVLDGGSYGFAVDETNAYIANPSEGIIGSVPLTGGPFNVLVSGLSFPFGLAVDDTNLYCADQLDGIIQVPKGGGTALFLSSFGNVFNVSVAVDDTTIYWVQIGHSNDGAVSSVPIGGGPITVLASGQSFPIKIAIDDVNVYWFNSGGSIASIPKTGGTVTTLAVPAYGGNLSGFAVDNAYVYWTDFTAGAVNRVSKFGGGSIETLASVSSAPAGMCISNGFVYFGDNGLNTVSMVAVAGGPTTLLAASPEAYGVINIAANKSNVYWLNIFGLDFSGQVGTLRDIQGAVEIQSIITEVGTLVGNSSLGARPTVSTPYVPSHTPGQPEPPPAPMVRHKYKIKLPV